MALFNLLYLVLLSRGFTVLHWKHGSLADQDSEGRSVNVVNREGLIKVRVLFPSSFCKSDVLSHGAFTYYMTR